MNWGHLLANVGVPIFVAVYLLVRFEAILRENTTAIRDVHRFMKSQICTENADKPRS